MTTSKARNHSGDAKAATPSPASLAALCGLATLAALWALLLWTELVRVRGGGVCSIGGGEGCAAVWDAAFAVAVHRVTGLPVAAWGLAWGLAALALPLAALLRAAEGRPAAALFSAIRFSAGGAVAAVFALMAVSASERAFCAGCAVTYVLVAGYAGIALFGWPHVGLPEPRRAALLAGGAVAAGAALLLYPGLLTSRPRADRTAGRAAVAAGGDDLAVFVASLAPELRQTLADSLHLYRQGPAFEPPLPRAILGAADAPVRITEFTDVLCEHCAELHETLGALREHLPEGSFAVESRQFPLDGRCNPLLGPRTSDPVRCAAAKARICLEGHAGAFDFDGALFGRQRGLTPETVLELAAPFVPRPSLEACLGSPETAAKLEADVAAAARYAPEGTPLVLVNGRKAVSVPAFLYAIVLARGDAAHPAFATLPEPNPRAHLH